MPEDQSQKIDKPKPDSLDAKTLAERMSRLEKKLAIVLGLVVVQTLLVSAWMLSYLLPTFFVYLQMVVILVAILGGIYVFRKKIPGWFGSIARSMFALLHDAEKKI